MTATNGFRILASAPIDVIATEILEQFAPVETAPSPDEETLMGMLENTVGLVCRGVEARASARLIGACPTLRVIGRPGAGYDTVDLDAANARRIPVIFAPIGGFAVAEGALALLLSIVKKILWSDQVVKTGQWRRRYEIVSGDMAEHTLGIIGLGRIGAHLAKLAQPFGMKILGYDPRLTAASAGVPWVEDVGMSELLRQSDYVSIHVPLSEGTKGLINRKSIGLMKPGAILINTARGAVVESLDVLAEALEGGQLSAVGLDVFPTEPPDSSHRIFSDPRLVCAPHLLGVSELAMSRIYRSMATDMISVLNHRRPEFCVNPEVLG
jgi:D-3-phosphoglycerate dehydrogenase / 2-oxoglutarate reductase